MPTQTLWTDIDLCFRSYPVRYLVTHLKYQVLGSLHSPPTGSLNSHPHSGLFLASPILSASLSQYLSPINPSHTTHLLSSPLLSQLNPSHTTHLLSSPLPHQSIPHYPSPLLSSPLLSSPL